MYIFWEHFFKVRQSLFTRLYQYSNRILPVWVFLYAYIAWHNLQKGANRHDWLAASTFRESQASIELFTNGWHAATSRALWLARRVRPSSLRESQAVRDGRVTERLATRQPDSKSRSECFSQFRFAESEVPRANCYREWNHASVCRMSRLIDIVIASEPRTGSSAIRNRGLSRFFRTPKWISLVIYRRRESIKIRVVEVVASSLSKVN